MKRLMVPAVFGLACLVAACGPQAQKPTDASTGPSAQAPATSGCSAETVIDWAPVSGPPMQIAARASGPSCDTGMASIAITDAAGKSLFAGEFDIAPMTTTVFAEAKTPETLKAALQRWIDPTDQMMATTQQLPDWASGADAPQSGEFPFYPAEGTTRDAYARLRARALPMFCFVQGGESMQCLALDKATGALIDVGLQTFPG